MAMEELQSLLAKCEMADVVSFDHLNNRVWCYTHIINICSSHIIASFTSTSKSYLAGLKVPLNCNYPTHNDSDSNDKSSYSDDNVNDKGYKFKLPGCYDHQGNSKFRAWAKGIKRDPLRPARRVICLLHSSDKHRKGFQKFIQDGNRHGWFTMKDGDGKCTAVVVPELQLLRDVKMRWDSVYLMLLHL